MIIVPAWTKTEWGKEATFEMLQRLGPQFDKGEIITQAKALQTAQDVLRDYLNPENVLNLDLQASEPYVREPAKQEVAALRNYIRRFS